MLGAGGVMLLKTAPSARPCDASASPSMATHIFRSITPPSPLGLLWDAKKIHDVPVMVFEQLTEKLGSWCRIELPKNVVGHGWPERSAHGCARSGFWKGILEPA